VIHLGQHATVNGRMETGIEAARLNDVEFLCALVGQAYEAAGARVIDLISHQFKPHGVTVLALLAESHAALHTWPEHRAWTFEIFLCGKFQPEPAIAAIRHGLPGWTAMSVHTVEVT